MERRDPQEKRSCGRNTSTRQHGQVRAPLHRAADDQRDARRQDQIGTMGDMPSLVLSTKQKIADMRLVSVTMFSNGQTSTSFWWERARPSSTTTTMP